MARGLTRLGTGVPGRREKPRGPPPRGGVEADQQVIMAQVAGAGEPLSLIRPDAPDFSPHSQLLVELHTHAPFL